MNGFKKSSSQKKPLLQGFLLDFKKGKTIICLVALLMLATAKTSASDNNPVANPEAVVICGKACFTVLTPEMIRIEYLFLLLLLFAFILLSFGVSLFFLLYLCKQIG